MTKSSKSHQINRHNHKRLPAGRYLANTNPMPERQSFVLGGCDTRGGQGCLPVQPSQTRESRKHRSNLEQISVCWGMICAPNPAGETKDAALNDAATGPDWADLTEQTILDQALILAATMGWSDQLVNLAGKKAGLSPAETDLLLPHGAADLAALLSKRHDGAALSQLNQQNPSALKIRGRIEAGIMARLAMAANEGQAAHAWAGYLALPHHLPLALRLVWDSADMIWRWAGDTATDENHYSKRALVGAILMAGLAAHLSSGEAAAKVVVAARIDNVMAFESWKFKTKPAARLQAWATGLAAKLGQVRYGSEP